MGGTASREKTAQPPGGGTLWPTVVLLAILAYIASSGPVYVLWVQDGSVVQADRFDAYCTVYYPIMAVAKSWKPFGALWAWWLTKCSDMFSHGA